MSWLSRLLGGKTKSDVRPQRLDYLNEALVLERQQGQRRVGFPGNADAGSDGVRKSRGWHVGRRDYRSFRRDAGGSESGAALRQPEPCKSARVRLMKILFD